MDTESPTGKTLIVSIEINLIKKAPKFIVTRP